jgi:hypothetical protein
VPFIVISCGLAGDIVAIIAEMYDSDIPSAARSEAGRTSSMKLPSELNN